jgi:hypothetical protein
MESSKEIITADHIVKDMDDEELSKVTKSNN